MTALPNMVSRGWELDDGGYIHRGQCYYVGWGIGIVRSEQLRLRTRSQICTVAHASPQPKCQILSPDTETVR